MTRADQHDVYSDGDDVARWMKANPNHAVPKWAFEALYDALKDALAQRDSALRVLKNSVLALEARLAGVDDTLARHRESLDSRGVPIRGWTGPHVAGAVYRAGDITQKNGIWFCLKDTSAAPGSDPSAWKLWVHRKLVPSDD